ncbi:hypothetical protein [Pseudonocardia humida]|uniref:Uncharacterized protein n=1 Tax=Pseudonocardia humida TaxID=2800819 RepID=A0ABT1AC66_9PSEU|nr:hypothetical protein [Pseudonocardia humida]MCO1660515.1 hypothetical protein [Pseudonocardia humida]
MLVGLADGSPQGGDERVGVGGEGFVVDPQRVATAQPGDAGRQDRRARHGRPVDQDRHDVDAVAQCGLDLQRDDVVGTIDASSPLAVPQGGPLSPDEREQDVAPPHRRTASVTVDTKSAPGPPRHRLCGDAHGYRSLMSRSVWRPQPGTRKRPGRWLRWEPVTGPFCGGRYWD